MWTECIFKIIWLLYKSMSFPVFGKLIVIVMENVTEFIKLISQGPPDSHQMATWAKGKSELEVIDSPETTSYQSLISQGSFETTKHKDFLPLL